MTQAKDFKGPNDGLSEHPDALALLFTDQGIMFDRSAYSPFISSKQAFEQIKAQPLVTHLLDKVLIMRCTIPLTDAQLRKQGFRICPVKAFLSRADVSLQPLILGAHHWLQWDSQSQYCGQCGHALQSLSDSTEKQCTHCQASFFPRFSPAVITVVMQDAKILLARSPHFPAGVYSALAGFIDIGETAESAVLREVEEEVGLKITRPEYVGSQPWPFPDQFMLAFKAHYLSGDLVINQQEIEDARWFSADDLPKLPEKASIARQLIDKVLELYKE